MTITVGRFETDKEMPESIRTELPETSRHKHGPYRRVFKRMLDILLILLAAPFVLPMVLVLAFLVARDGGKPFYAQERLGKNGKVFKMWKLRSMVVDADAQMAAYLAANPDAAREWELTQKLRMDPRITPFGHFLRRSSLDELPQLWNVFIGDMSLVGPRPMMVSQKELYPAVAYYRLRPGVTGLWQTAGRHRTTFAARADFDSEYEAHITFVQDLRILVKTVGVVVDASGV